MSQPPRRRSRPAATGLVAGALAALVTFAAAPADDLPPEVQQVDLIAGSLARSGIDVHTRGLYLRSLLHFFGPLFPVVVMVPTTQAAEARRLIARSSGSTRRPAPAGRPAEITAA